MRIFGTICEAGSGRAIENLIVRAYNRDILFDEPLGFATSRFDGSFEIRANERQAAALEQLAGFNGDQPDAPVTRDDEPDDDDDDDDDEDPKAAAKAKKKAKAKAKAPSGRP